MGKTSNCLKMLQILSSGRVYKGQELADILETNVRNIAEYRTELEMAGYYIEGIPGKYGGYRLITQSVIPTVRLNEAEQRALSSGAEYLKSRNDFLSLLKFLSVGAMSQHATQIPYLTISEETVCPSPIFARHAAFSGATS